MFSNVHIKPLYQFYRIFHGCPAIFIHASNHTHILSNRFLGSSSHILSTSLLPSNAVWLHTIPTTTSQYLMYLKTKQIQSCWVSLGMWCHIKVKRGGSNNLLLLQIQEISINHKAACLLLQADWHNTTFGNVVEHYIKSTEFKSHCE